MTLPTLILQKPLRTSKTKDHINCIERRLDLWLKGDIDALIMEGRTIQRSFKPSENARSDKRSAASFAKLMMGGKVRAALRLLMDNDSGGPLSLDNIFDNKSVREILLEKHPNGNPMDSSAITLPEFPTQEPHPVIFDQITGSLIRSVAFQMEGAAGPSNVDSYAWR